MKTCAVRGGALQTAGCATAKEIKLIKVSEAGGIGKRLLRWLNVAEDAIL